MVNGVGMNKAMADSIEKKKHCSLLRLEITPERIHFLKFILEGYDGLAFISTVASRPGIVEIRYPPESKNDLEELMFHIKPQIEKNFS